MLEGQPEVPPEAEWAWEAFLCINSFRPIEGPIPLSEIRSYCLLFGVQQREKIEDLVYYVDALDKIVLKYYNDQRKREMERK